MTGHTTQLQHLLDLAISGDDSAWESALSHSCTRLRELGSRMLRTNPRIKRWSETDDLLQNALIRLHRSLSEVRPESARQFYGLATMQMRRELIDLARKYYGAGGLGANHQTDGEYAAQKQTEKNEPRTLQEWSRFHEAVENLPVHEKEVVNLIWYQETTKTEASKLLGVSLATVKRRWQAARLQLSQSLDDKEFK